MTPKARGKINWNNISLREVLHFKWNQLRWDKRKPVLWVVEVLLATGLAAGMALYLDPDWNVAPFPWNVVSFGVLLAAAILVHRRTRPYRIALKMNSKKR